MAGHLTDSLRDFPCDYKKECLCALAQISLLPSEPLYSFFPRFPRQEPDSRMKFLAFSVLTFLVSSATCSPLLQRQTASPPSIPSDKLPSYTHAADLTIPFPIHESCNITLRRQLEHALDETAQLAYYAKRHLLLHGLDSLFVNKYFGNHSTATAIGWYDRILSASKFDVLFRCDDPDKNCATQDGMFPPEFLQKPHKSEPPTDDSNRQAGRVTGGALMLRRRQSFVPCRFRGVVILTRFVGLAIPWPSLRSTLSGPPI